jgi:hypothetical protein
VYLDTVLLNQVGMSNNKKNKKSQWGGRREGAGAKGRTGGTVKFCVSVSETVWQDASKMWNGNRSQLVDHLLRGFVATKAAI